MNVVAVERTLAADIFLKSNFIQFESGNGNSVAILQRPLQQAVAATDLCTTHRLPDTGIGEAAHNFETPPNPKMAGSGNIEPPVAHVYGHGLTQVFDGARFAVLCWQLLDGSDMPGGGQLFAQSGMALRCHNLGRPLKYTIFHKVIPSLITG